MEAMVNQVDKLLDNQTKVNVQVFVFWISSWNKGNQLAAVMYE